MRSLTKKAWTESSLRDDLLQISPAGSSLVMSKLSKANSVARTVQSRLEDYISVKDFGAIGNGVADDTAAIQAAINSGAKCLYFPEGTYIVTTLNPLSNQAWVGAGEGNTILSWPQSNNAGYNMIQTTGGIQNFHVRAMSFRGARPYQTTNSVTGQDMGCFHFRSGNVINISIRNCTIYEFGDAAGVGGFGVLIGSLTGTSRQLSNIVVADCTFRNITNVPGVYINGSSIYHSKMSNIYIERNLFDINITTSDQNCIYILGDSGLLGLDIFIDSNRFIVNWAIDCAIELNWVSGFQVIHNVITAYGSGNCTPILIRDGCNLGMISGNQVQGRGTGTGDATAISLVRFNTGTQTQTNINITGNIIQSWGTSSAGRAIGIGAGSSQIACTNNIVVGASSSTRIAAGVSVGHETSNILVSDNVFRYVTYVANFAGTVSNFMFESNVIDQCGDGSVSMVIDNVANFDMTYVVFRSNTVSNPISGTPNFVSLSPAATTGNRIEANVLPSTLNAMNASFLSKFSSVVTPSTGSGQAVVARKYTFAQGAVAMADGQGFTIGGNLDAQVPVCAFGDTVLATFNGDSLGVTINAYVSAANTVRIRVQNETGASVTVPAGNWTVVIFKQ